MNTVFYSRVTLLPGHIARGTTPSRRRPSRLPRVGNVAALAVKYVERRVVAALVFHDLLWLPGRLEDAGRVADPVIVLPVPRAVPADGRRHLHGRLSIHKRHDRQE